MTQIIDYEAGIKELESIDSRIEAKLETESYKSILELLNSRMVVISQLNILNRSQTIPEELLKKFKAFVDNSELLQHKIVSKKASIHDRLSKHRKTIVKNKNFGYGRKK